MKNFKTQIYLDGADFNLINNFNKKKFIKGFTTNPSLMRKSGIKHYKKFCLKVLKIVQNKPVSFEVFADLPDEIKKQANYITCWGKNVFVKIPILNSKGLDLTNLILELNNKGIKINVTAIFALSQIKKLINKINNKTNIILSIFAGRIADTGRDPEIVIKDIIKYSSKKKNIRILWASPREIFNIYQANRSNCHIITLSDDLIKKLSFYNKNLNEFSKETSLMFYNDAKIAGFKL
jgi:transaldolase